MTVSDNCLLISGQRARVGIPGATQYGLKWDMIEEIKRNFHEGNPLAKTIPDKPFLAVDRNPILLMYVMEIDPDNNPKRKINSNNEAII
jgi:hypothetical protein